MPSAPDPFASTKNRIVAVSMHTPMLRRFGMVSRATSSVISSVISRRIAAGRRVPGGSPMSLRFSSQRSSTISLMVFFGRRFTNDLRMSMNMLPQTSGASSGPKPAHPCASVADSMCSCCG